MKSKICLIRHGITEGNKKKLYYGHADIPLTAEGIEEIRKLSDEGIYPDGSGADFYTSGLMRTEQTLEIIYGKQQHEAVPGLKEINFGDFEMKSYRELKELEEYKIWIADKWGDHSPPNGESLRTFYKRVVRCFEELKGRHSLKAVAMRHKEEEAVSIVVCHGGTISAILESIYPREKENLYGWIPDPGHGYILSLENSKIVNTDKF